jgi:hypothetical protein
MLTGRQPFTGDSAFDILFHAATEPVPPMPEVPAAVEAVVHRMLAKDPRDRFDDMAALYREVAAIDAAGHRDDDTLVTGPLPVVEERGSPPTLTDPVAPPARPKARRVMIAAAAAAVLASVAVASSRDAPPAAPPVVQAPVVAAAALATLPEAAPAAPPSAAVALPPRAASEDEDVEIIVVEDPEPRPATAKIRPPPNDAQILRRLRRRSKARCGGLLGDDPLQVTFGIGEGGEVLAPRGSRRGPATDCVLATVGRTRFNAGELRREVLSL